MSVSNDLTRPIRSEELDLDDVQANVLVTNRLRHAVYVFFHISERSLAKQWLAGVLDGVTTAATPVPGSSARNIAFTHAGLAALGQPDEVLSGFPPAFTQGMAARAEILGDLGTSHPEHWRVPNGGDVHGVLVAFGEADAVDSAADALIPAGTQGVAEVGRQRGDAIMAPDGRFTIEHFGFADGVSQPKVLGPAGPDRLALGELILGHEDEAGDTATPWPHSPAERTAAWTDLVRNGTYLVYRQLAQNVPGFRRFVRQLPTDLADLFAARMVGRWPSGAPLRPGELTDPGSDATTMNDISFAADPGGRTCPFGAHIRRSNPRDDQRFGPLGANRHRMMRRGITYGRYLDDGAEDTQERGLLFVAYCADIERQFEFVQTQWLNDGDAFGLRHEPDPIAGNHGGSTLVDPGFTIDGPKLPLTLDLPAFVTTRAGEYFFQPSISTLQRLAG